MFWIQQLVISAMFTIFVKTKSTRLSVNDTCTDHRGEIGTCSTPDTCKNIQSTLQSGVRPMICGFPPGDNIPYICCQREFQSPFEITNLKCLEYSKLVKKEIKDSGLGSGDFHLDRCGPKADKTIFERKEALPREFPYIALVGYGEATEWLCAASLISDKFLLSAAHCASIAGSKARWILLGELDTSAQKDDARPQHIRIEKIIPHPEFNPTTMMNDLALFKLNKSVHFDSYVRPVCLPSTSESPPMENTLIAAGWGLTTFGGGRSSILFKVSLKQQSWIECNRNYTSGSQSRRKLLPGRTICAGAVFKDIYQGDSGGPLLADVSHPYCMQQLVGVTSFGQSCGSGSAGVYTLVSYYVPWIVGHVWPDHK